MQKCRKIFIVLFSVFYVIFSPVASVFALDNNQSTSNIEKSDEKENKNQINSPNNSAIIGSKNERTEKPKQETESPPDSKEPTITNVTVTGDFDKDAKGVDFFKKIQINLIGENLTDNNFLTKEGLHWSDKSTVELIKGVENGFINSETYLGKQNNPTTSVKAYSMNVGDSGRINYVGKTKSGVDLDLIWTVTGNDSADWKKNSGYYSSSRATGLAFTGEQSIPNSTGNSIVVLYTEANTLGLHYKIVKHGTLDEQPVILSFISTDIDAAQGVQTDLANIVELIPNESGLKKSTDGVIYDATPKMMALNGSSDLPKGGYLGAGFLSSFNYTFYSPAPPRFNNSYDYALGVRYDIFGSSLQADILTRITQRIRVKYVDSSGKELKKEEHYSGFTDKSYKVDSISIPKYRLVNIDKNVTDKNNPIITFIYQPEHKVTLHFVDEQGTKIQESKTFTVLEGQTISYTPNSMDGFITPNKLKQIAVKDVDYQFVYKKVPKQEQKPSEETKNPVKTTPKKEVNKQNTGTGVVSNVGSVVANHSSAKKTINVEESPVFKNTPSIQSSSHTKTGVVSNVGPFVANHSSAKKTINVEESPVFKNTPSIQSSSYNVSYNTEETGVQEKKDPFLENTGMTQENKKKFLNYIHEVAKNARTKYGNDQNKINHAIANAIAYSSYHNNFLQKSTNDFWEKPENLTDDMEELLKNIHEDKLYKLDFPHLAMPLATAEKSVWYKEVGKFIAGLSPLNIVGVTPSDTFFQANSLLGDELTIIDNKDLITDIDAYILKYHPEFKDLPLNERIEKYYSTDNLNKKRGEYYKEVLESKSEGTGMNNYSTILKFGSMVTFAALGLFLLNIKKGISDYLDAPGEMIKEKIIPTLINNFEELKKDPLAYATKKTSARLGNFVADTIVTAKAVVTFTANKINNNIIKPIFNRAVKPIYNAVIRPISSFMYNKVAKPIYNNVVKPVYNKVIKPVVKWGYSNIVKPVYNRVIKPVAKWEYNNVVKPVYNKVIKPVVKWGYSNIVKPVYNRVIKPVVKWGYNNTVKPVYNKVIKPVAKWGYNNVVKPFVEPIYNKVIKPASNWISDKYNKAKSWLKKWF